MPNEIIAEIAVEGDARLAPHDVMIERVARRSDRLQRRIAQPLAVVDLFAVGGLEQQPG